MMFIDPLFWSIIVASCAVIVLAILSLRILRKVKCNGHRLMAQVREADLLEHKVIREEIAIGDKKLEIRIAILERKK